MLQGLLTQEKNKAVRLQLCKQINQLAGSPENLHWSAT
jgi:hypothetical protein